MKFSDSLSRVRSEFVEMPGLELTVPQAVRLCGIGPDDCREVIEALVDAGFLRWTTRRTVIRTGRAWKERDRAYISVRQTLVANNSVLVQP